MSSRCDSVVEFAVTNIVPPHSAPRVQVNCISGPNRQWLLSNTERAPLVGVTGELYIINGVPRIFVRVGGETGISVNSLPWLGGNQITTWYTAQPEMYPRNNISRYHLVPPAAIYTTHTVGRCPVVNVPMDLHQYLTRQNGDVRMRQVEATWREISSAIAQRIGEVEDTLTLTPSTPTTVVTTTLSMRRCMSHPHPNPWPWRLIWTMSRPMS